MSELSSHKYTEKIVRINPDGTTRIEKTRYDISVLPKENTKLGVMLVGWGGNNGCTLTASLLAYKRGVTFGTKNRSNVGVDFFGSLSQYGSVHIGYDDNVNPKSKLFKEIADFYDPRDLVIGGWDICSDNMYDASTKSHVMEPGLLDQLKNDLKVLTPLPSVFNKNFVSSTQISRANNFLWPNTALGHLDTIKRNIRNFKQKNNLYKVVIFWTASTERFSMGTWNTAEDIKEGFNQNSSEISPSMIFCLAAIETPNCIFINGSPQNTITPGMIELARLSRVHIAGEDLKSGQTRLKSVLVDFLASSGIKPLSIVSYNHLGNNDGKNLSEEPQFKSKEITKRNVIDDVVADNPRLFSGKNPDHCVVIKYVPAVGDSKRAMDEYYSELMFDGRHTMAIHNTCEDSLLAVPVMLDLILFSDFLTRIRISTNNQEKTLDCTLCFLSYFFKSPSVGAGTPLINSFFKQRLSLENFFRILLGLPTLDHVNLGYRI